jgi:predicted regulator of Ras-like GTPase activity (Roadblock/LC7/MglB family)
MINSSLSGILQDLVGREHCKQAILVTRAGSLVAQAGGNAVPLEQNLGPIIAAVFGTGRELGRLLGASHSEWHLQRGRRADLFLFPMPGEMVCVACFPPDTEEERAVSLAQHLETHLQALSPAMSARRRVPLPPELREEAMGVLDLLFAA